MAAPSWHRRSQPRNWRRADSQEPGFAFWNFFYGRFGAIWCDWVRKVQSSKFKVQGSKFRPELEEAKIAGSGRPPARSNLVGSLVSLLLSLIGFDWV
jgi:hypothetical protein